MTINMPQDVRFIIGKLMEAGYEAYAVGGCVRDSLLGREPNDWDITTSATPYEVKDIFRRTVDTGLKHGTVTVLLKKEGYEVKFPDFMKIGIPYTLTAVMVGYLFIWFVWA